MTVEQLSENFDAVIYAIGAATGRRLEVPGEDLPGVHSGPEFVGWYNAHPDIPAGDVQLTSERAIVIGTGNVALDVARILSTEPDELARTDIAEHALDALRTSPVREVVVLGRRGPEEAAYSAPELLALGHLPGVELVVDDSAPDVAETIDAAEPGDHAELLQDARAPPWRPTPRRPRDGGSCCGSPARSSASWARTSPRVSASPTAPWCSAARS